MTDAPTLPLDGQLCFSIYSTSLAIQRVYKPMLDGLGVTYTQYLVLSALWEKDGLTISAIGERLALEPSTITPAVKRLEAAGFLSRRRSTIDERLVEVYLTAKGQELHPKTGCLTDALLRNSGFEIPQMIELNRSVQALRQGMRTATSGGNDLPNRPAEE
ncbi:MULTISPECIES: MarR family transcriptional regulator [unclassified Bosea (in: a-proteobacteria)]|uniref:MarR family winged helix-turn-helix transcriptional regulator n=1 Tax=unclassified Bosea (in: a-proteobacteria) TaxID=2653178 RepID=UPI000F756B59|nr:MULTISPECIES: MarR family transcriptional regulator [unclassified Bosea (in: a-proteobacteria)]AZO78198.1 MarR family transcriptional regulator [Bosea sp. Tri-49]RXT20316.1 MarR family transcriptional regulator [Bosea sp. Tri-39]RXT37188.1 MarR family transcriptional regulator [Bosea sp. Tri-54]